jgi:hypothetical protein
MGALSRPETFTRNADLADRAALKAFLVEVQSRLKTQAANPGA